MRMNESNLISLFQNRTNCTPWQTITFLSLLLLPIIRQAAREKEQAREQEQTREQEQARVAIEEQEQARVNIVEQEQARVSSSIYITKLLDIIIISSPEATLIMRLYQLETFCSSKEEHEVEVVEVGCPMVCRTEGFLLNTYQEDFTGGLTLVEDNCIRIRLSLERLSLKMLAFAKRTVSAFQESGARRLK